MNDLSPNIDTHLDRAVAPNLFDAVLDPELIFSLVLANLMSPRLWDLRERLLQSPDPAQHTSEGTIQRIQHVIDRRFEHIPPPRVVDMNGVLDLDTEAERLGSGAVEYALSQIVSSFDWRIQRGTVPKEALCLDLIKQRKFPAYVYATIDEAHAYRRFLQGRKHKPIGLTCCLDEAAIFTALNLILPPGMVDDIALIGSPAHYSVLTWSPEGAWWFYSKHELFSPSTWSQFVADPYAGDAQLAFDDRLPRFDRIISVSGAYAFATGETSMPESRRAELASKIEAFFGFRPAQLDRALQHPAHAVAATDLAATVATVATASGAEEVRSRLRHAAFDDEHPAALRAFYTFRALDLPDLTVYLRAARRSNQIGEQFGPIQTIDDAVRCVAAIDGTNSIFEDADRIAMPDETARFATGTDRDKALLLHVLIERTLAADDPARTELETLFTNAGSYVRSPRFCISTTRMAEVPEVEGSPLHRIADW
jgi:hypothetical protein